MKTDEIAQRLVTLCREVKWDQAQRELYASDAVSIEPHATPLFPKETHGLPAILEKGRTFAGIIETMHSSQVSDPLVTENAFACTMRLDVTLKGKGRMQMTELGVYDVKDGKIVAEHFHA